MDSTSPNYTEYAYEQKNEGKVRVARTLMVIGYVVFFVGLFAILMLSSMPMLFAIAPLLLYILVLCTWRFVKYDLYWEFGTGTLEAGKIKVNKSGRHKTPKVSIHIKEALDIGYYENSSQLGEVKKVYDYSESPSSDKRIYIVFSEGGARSALIIEGTARLANLLTSFCERAHDIKGKPFHG